jgi:hypothetical protein
MGRRWILYGVEFVCFAPVGLLYPLDSLSKGNEFFDM